jgi:hypothetical protein
MSELSLLKQHLELLEACELELHIREYIAKKPTLYLEDDFIILCFIFPKGKDEIKNISSAELICLGEKVDTICLAKLKQKENGDHKFLEDEFKLIYRLREDSKILSKIIELKDTRKENNAK